MTQRPNLEPCPFCNSKKVVVAQYGVALKHQEIEQGSYSVMCDDCGASGPEITGRSFAISAWNNRPPSAGELHWRNNHASVVAKSRVLIDRPDMPLERVKAFQYITEMEQRIERLKGHIVTMTTEF